MRGHMRLGSLFPLASIVASAFTVTACSVDIQPTPAPTPAPSTVVPEEPAPMPSPPATPPPAAPAVGTIDESVFAEVVYVEMRDHLHQLWICTGTLVSPRTVVTAAHCLDTSMFVSYEVRAPLAPGKPTASASQPAAFGGTFEDVANPDIGILTLDTPITLPRYAELTDIVSRVESGDAIEGQAVVRTAEERNAPLQPSPKMPVSSTVGFGYEHGFGTPMFSKGGDSGAGLFLVENGKPTHKLVGVARQPEPVRDLDHFTRIDAPFLAWFAENTAHQP